MLRPFFDIEKSAFICKDCPQLEGINVDCEHLRLSLIMSKNLSWKSFSIGAEGIKNNAEHLKRLINYLIFQLNLNQDSLKTVKSLY